MPLQLHWLARVSAVWAAAVRTVCAWLRPLVARRTLPENVVVHCGAPHRIEAAILAELLRHTPGVVRVHEPPSATPGVWLDDDEHGTEGCMPACRLLGRVARLYPSAAVDALVVDAALEPLHTLLATPVVDETHVAAFVARLCHVHQGVVWLQTDVPSVADVAAFAALRWARERHLLPPAALGPLCDWYDAAVAHAAGDDAYQTPSDADQTGDMGDDAVQTHASPEAS